MPAEIHHLTDGWLELESDPGLFTLLIEDFGCKGVQVEEIYDLQKPNLIDGTVYGFIFLFKWLEERRSRLRDRYNPTYSLNKSNGTGSNGGSTSSNEKESPPVYIEDEKLINSIFFATQIIPNSCATHALLSVLLNSSNVELGPVLHRIKEHTVDMNPDNKGYAIGNTPELAVVHNAHASVHDLPDGEKISAGTTARAAQQRGAVSNQDSFHFVSYVPINGRLYELDGLKRCPIDHGPIEQGVEWSEKFRRIITARIEKETQFSNSVDAGGHDIRYNLMAVVPDRRVQYLSKLNTLRSNRHIVLEAIECMMRPTRLPGPFDYHNYSKYPPGLSYNEAPPTPNVIEPVTAIKENGANEDHNIGSSVTKSTMASPSTLASSNSSITPIGTPLTVDTTSGYQIQFSKSTYSSVKSLTTPLKIQTSISPALSSSSSTDTSSEAGSAFNSPNAAANSVFINPNEKCEKFFVMKMSAPAEVCITESHTSKPLEETISVQPDLSQLTPRTKEKAEKITQNSKTNGMRDILKLLKALEEEINVCESNLKEELDKRKKFRVDDSRRTHNYDEFITTFLLMLAEQGKLPDLLEKGLSNGSSLSNVPPVNGFDDDSPQSPSAFFAELQNTFEEVKDEKPLRTRSGNGLAEFMTKITNSSQASPPKQTPTPPSRTTQRSNRLNGSVRVPSTVAPLNVRSRGATNGNASKSNAVSSVKSIKSVAALAAARKRKRKRGSMTRYGRKF